MGGLFGGGGGGSVQTVNPPKPLQLDLSKLESDMTGADQAAYAQGDQYMSQYYPALTQARDSMIGTAYKNLTGPLDPKLENTFVNQGNMGSAAALGGGNQDYGLGSDAPPAASGAKANTYDGGGGKFGGAGAGSSWGGSGSLARNAAAATVAQDTMANQDYNRSLFEQLNTMYAPRSFGMTPEDAANIFTFNNSQLNNYLEQKFAAQTNAYYQNQGAAASSGASTIGVITSIIGAAATAY